MDARMQHQHPILSPFHPRWAGLGRQKRGRGKEGWKHDVQTRIKYSLTFFHIVIKKNILHLIVKMHLDDSSILDNLAGE